jgi:hypothetical protein
MIMTTDGSTDSKDVVRLEQEMHDIESFASSLEKTFGEKIFATPATHTSYESFLTGMLIRFGLVRTTRAAQAVFFGIALIAIGVIVWVDIPRPAVIPGATPEQFNAQIRSMQTH